MTVSNAFYFKGMPSDSRVDYFRNNFIDVSDDVVVGIYLGKGEHCDDFVIMFATSLDDLKQYRDFGEVADMVQTRMTEKKWEPISRTTFEKMIVKPKCAIIHLNVL